MKTISLNDLELNFRTILSEIAHQGETVTVIKDGNPIVKIVPIEGGEEEPPFGSGAVIGQTVPSTEEDESM